MDAVAVGNVLFGSSLSTSKSVTICYNCTLRRFLVYFRVKVRIGGRVRVMARVVGTGVLGGAQRQ